MSKKKIKNYFSEINITLLLLLYFIFIVIYVFYISYDNELSICEKEDVYKIKTADVITFDEEYIENIEITTLVKTNKPFDVIIDISEYLKRKKGTFTDSIFMNFFYCDAKVYADDKEIFRLEKPDKSLSESGGYNSVIFDIPRNIENHYIRIHFIPNIKSINENNISEIMIGRKSDIIVTNLISDIAAIMLSSCLIINFILILFFVLIKREIFVREHYSLLNLGILGLFFGCYYLTQLNTIIYFGIKISEFIYFIEYISLCLALVPILSYTKNKVNYKFKLYINIMLFVLILNISVQIICTIFKIVEFKELLSITLTLVAFIGIITFILIIVDSKSLIVKKGLILPTLMIMCPVVISIVYYFYYNIFLLNKIGNLILVAVLMIEYIEIYEKYKKFYEQQIKKNIYKKLAITDALTGLLNRQAHEEFIKKIKEQKLCGYLLSIDINDLKYVNDTYGHIKGDELITEFSKIIADLQEKNKNIYAFRIGGDEFFIFVKEVIFFDIKSFVTEIKKKYSDSSKDSEVHFKYSFSVGFSYYDSCTDRDIIEIYHEADKKMYEDKTEYKKMKREKEVEES